MSKPASASHFHNFDRGAVPAALEMDTQFGLEEFERLSQQVDEVFADTLPLTPEQIAALHGQQEAPRAQEGASMLENTLPVGLGVNTARAALEALPAGAAAAPLTVSHAMLLCRSNGRVAPLPQHWASLLALVQRETGCLPPEAPAPTALAKQSKLLQRLALKDVLTWAHERAVLDKVVALLESLPEQGWLHYD